MPVDGYAQNVPKSPRTYLSEPEQAPYGTAINNSSVLKIPAI